MVEPLKDLEIHQDGWGELGCYAYSSHAICLYTQEEVGGDLATAGIYLRVHEAKALRDWLTRWLEL